jgi:TolB-like protein
MSGDLSAPNLTQLKRKKSKVRSAWISFVGRIVAQVIGAIASVTLGLVVLHKYGFAAPPKSSAVAQAAPVNHVDQHKARRASGDLALAVLPIQNYSKDAEHAYFADGVTEALITELTQVAGLHVTSRTSSMAYKGTTKPLREIARDLDVDMILEGSVVRDQGRVRVTAQLIDANSDQHLWARSYDRPIGRLLPLQSELAKSIVQEVSLALRPWTGAQASGEGVVNARSDR